MMTTTLRNAGMAMGLASAACAAPAMAQSSSAGCAGATSTVDIQNCQQATLKRANAALNATYQQRLSAATAARKVQLRDDERAWIRQRDQACAVKPDSGSAGSLDVGQCLIRQTEQRTKQLQSGG